MLENPMIDIDKRDENGLNAFMVAAQYGNGEVMRVFAEHGIDIYNTDPDGNNALHVSAKHSERYNILHMLINSNFELNC